MSQNIVHKTEDDLIYYLDLNGGIDQCVYKTGTYEKYVANIINKYVNKNSVCLDIGANFGVHAVRMGVLGKKVICIEPMPINKRLEENLKANDTNYIIHDCMVGDQTHDNIPVNLEYEFNIYGESNKHKITNIKNMCKIDDIINEKIDFIKIDVDGCEYEALLGAVGLIEKYRPIIVSELTTYAINYDPVKKVFFGINDKQIVKKRWVNFVKLLLDRNYKIESVNYIDNNNIPTKAEDFENIFDKLHEKKYSSTDVLFIPA